jgi:hypothetical protein
VGHGQVVPAQAHHRRAGRSRGHAPRRAPGSRPRAARPRGGVQRMRRSYSRGTSGATSPGPGRCLAHLGELEAPRGIGELRELRRAAPGRPLTAIQAQVRAPAAPTTARTPAPLLAKLATAACRGAHRRGRTRPGRVSLPRTTV